MKRIIALAAALMLLFSLTACQKTKEDLRIYVLSGNEFVAGGGESELLSQAKAKGRIAFTGEDIKGWDWANHQVELMNVAVRGGAGDGGSTLFQAGPEDLFLLTIGQRVIYTGGFAPGSGSVASLRPLYIEDGEGDTFRIRLNEKYNEGEDPRADETLYNFLTDQQLLVSAVE